ncbi:hypothetical protein HK405_012430, partial [Cladochytrium tenue]
MPPPPPRGAASVSTEVLGRIFALMPLSLDILFLRRVCRAWKTVLESDWLCMRLLGPCLDELAWSKRIVERDASETYCWSDSFPPCWVSGQLAAGFFVDTEELESSRPILEAGDDELDDADFANA